MVAHICAYLNGNGGRVLIGFSAVPGTYNQLQVTGLNLTYADRDHIQQLITNQLYKSIHPQVNFDELNEDCSVKFIPVTNRKAEKISSLYVIKISVKQGYFRDQIYTCYEQLMG